ncbi:hypothetical protein [Bifidobacterium cuniculi]|uniref:HTH cro/C1-type domain-containing protein n=1 Tax=Bifidobacterium cuniculi TaxID=1688 RepID=A0A087B3X3_9BIFI|nr:hypothetical protein [Bifidobacterium cuniculi]KFI65723.1 hypothetical protein BCUN_0218 [Bifidobacterium cuniculi]
MKSRDNTVAASAIRSLRVQTLLDEVPKTRIAQALGVSRPTVAKYLKADDMSLDMFLSIADIVGVDAADIIRQATEKASEEADAESK